MHNLRPKTPMRFQNVHLNAMDGIPFFTPGVHRAFGSSCHVPMLVHVRPRQLGVRLNRGTSIIRRLNRLLGHNLHKSLGAKGLIANTLCISLSFCPGAPTVANVHRFGNCRVVPAIDNNLTRVRRQLVRTLSGVGGLPLGPVVRRTADALSRDRHAVGGLRAALSDVGGVLTDRSVRRLPASVRSALHRLGHDVRNFRPNSTTCGGVITSVRHLSRILQRLRPILGALGRGDGTLMFRTGSGGSPRPGETGR